MPEDKSDFRLVGAIPPDGSKPVGLRITKVVRGSDESLYTLLLPGVVPDPLKLSVHPGGEIQLKSWRAGLIARVDQGTITKSFQSGELDMAIAKFLTPKLEHEPAEGFLIGSDLIAVSPSLQNEPLQDRDLSIDQVLASLRKVQIDDVARLPEALGILRHEGLLHPKTVLQLVTENSDKPIHFLSLLEEPVVGERVPIPEETPFRHTMLAMLDSLGTYGGIVFSMPDEGELRELAQIVGLGDIFEGISRFANALQEPDVERHVREVMDEIAAGFHGAVEKISQATTIEPLRKAKPGVGSDSKT